MRKRWLKTVMCCFVSTWIIGAGSLVVNAADSTANLPVAGVSFGFGTENTIVEKEPDTSDTIEETKTSESDKSQKELDDIGIAQVEDYVNIRDAANEDGEILGKLYNNSAAVIKKKDGDWYKIKSGNVIGYVKCEYIVTGNESLIKEAATTVATVKDTETLRIRKKAKTNAQTVELISEGEELEVVDESKKNWVKVTAGDSTGFVSSDYVELTTEFEYAESIEEEKARLEAEAAAVQAQAAQSEASLDAQQESVSSVSSTGSSVASYACQFTGNPYVWGGTSLTNGADCSGFIMSVYANFGVSLPHSSGALRGVGYEVDYSQAQPGDIICYSGHVALYIGGGQIVHASTEETGIIISSATFTSILNVRRIF